MLNSYVFVIRKQNATRNCNVLFKFLYFGFLAPPNVEWLVVGKVRGNLGVEKGVVLVLSILVTAISPACALHKHYINSLTLFIML